MLTVVDAYFVFIGISWWLSVVMNPFRGILVVMVGFSTSLGKLPMFYSYL